MDALDERETEILLDGRYRLGSCLGRGGMAVVYRAEDTILGRTVAIKLLGNMDEAASTAERVHSETTILASLNHPSLVTLYDARLDPGHVRYLAMEYIDGPTLSKHLSHSALSGAETAALARDLSAALQVVHDAGIIHRDVKPSNVLLARSARRDAGWTAKLTDFGIAYSLSDPRMTSPGVVVGTAAYMAPEQVRGADLTPAVDIYSLGLVLIEALTGEPAFPVIGRVQTALRRLTESPAVPDSFGPDWSALLTRMTRTEPGERPSACEVAQAAAFLCDDPPPRGRRPGPIATPSALEPIRADGQITTPTREITFAGAPLANRARIARRSRAGALATMAGVAAAMITIAGFWAFAAPDESSGRVASQAPAAEIFTPPVAESEPPISDQTETESDTTDVPANNVTEDENDANADKGEKDEIDANPNKGPGNNSGNQKEQPGNDKKQ